MQQSSATQSLHLSFWGLRKIVACSHSSSQCLLVSTVFGTVSSLHPTSFLVCTCSNAASVTHSKLLRVYAHMHQSRSMRQTKSPTYTTEDKIYSIKMIVV